MLFSVGILTLSHSLLYSVNILTFTEKYEDTSLLNRNKLTSYSQIAKKVRVSVVNIATTQNVEQNYQENMLFKDKFYHKALYPTLNRADKFRSKSSLGSGLLLTRDGYAVTNYHLIKNNRNIKVSLYGDNHQYSARLIGSDKKRNLTVLKINKDNLTPIRFFDSQNIKVGDMAFAISNPYGLGERMIKGVVMGLYSTTLGEEKLIETDTSSVFSEGGALVNSLGALIAINSNGLSIPAFMAKRVCEDIINAHYIAKAYLGVRIVDRNDDSRGYYQVDEGAIVDSVVATSPAAGVGLMRGDLIVMIDTKRVLNGKDFNRIIGSYSAHSKIKIDYYRNRKLESVNVTLGDLESETKIKKSETGYKGAIVKALDAGHKQMLGIPDDLMGVIVSDVKEGSDAMKIGIIPNDLIMQIGPNEIESVTDFVDFTQTSRKKKFVIYRRGMVIPLKF
jgi:serine protease Do